MTEETSLIPDAIHRRLAVDLFNRVWDLLEMEARSSAEDDLMVHAAHASRYHWGEIGSALERERGEWQISRVYAVLGRPEAALYHAQRCLEICTEHQIGDFDLAFAYEALARANVAARHPADCGEAFLLAEGAAKEIKDDDDREYFLSELATIRCGGGG